MLMDIHNNIAWIFMRHTYQRAYIQNIRVDARMDEGSE